MTVEEFFALPDKYDFREEIMTFQPGMENAIDRYIVYQATGERDYKKDPNVKDAACKICKKYVRGKVPGKTVHADTCDLIRRIYEEGLFLDQDKNALLAPCRDRTGRLAIDTMNSCNTTIDIWLAMQMVKKENAEKLEQKKYGGKEAFYFPNKGNNWAVVKSVLLFFKDEEWFRELLAGAEGFLKAAYTVGNFIPWPVDCNGPRGTGCTKDYWDLTLKCIYDWYRNNRNLSRSDLDNTTLFSICGTEGTPIKRMEQWLVGFGGWDSFVKATDMQPFVYAKDGKSDAPDDGPFGPPKELWDGHFEAIEDTQKVLPNESQISEFFTNATERILARGGRMVDALRKAQKKPGK